MPWISSRDLEAIYDRLRRLEAGQMQQDYRTRLDRIATAVEAIAVGLQEATRYIHRLAGAGPVAGPFTLRVTGETTVHTSQGPKNMLTFDIMLPPPTATDVVKGELTYSIAGAEPITVETAVPQEAVVGLLGESGDRVTASFRFFDDETPPNVSEARTFDATLVDNLAPPQPGELGIRVTGES